MDSDLWVQLPVAEYVSVFASEKDTTVELKMTHETDSRQGLSLRYDVDSMYTSILVTHG